LRARFAGGEHIMRFAFHHKTAWHERVHICDHVPSSAHPS
jgi:hypothetical protein